MASCCSRIKEKLTKLSKLEIGFLINHICLIIIGLGSIIVGALTLLTVVSKFDTDRIKPLMDTITADGIQPIVALKNISNLFVIVGVIIVILSLPAVFIVRGNENTRMLGIFMQTFAILVLLAMEIAVLDQLDNTNDTVKNEIKGKMVLALSHFKADVTTNSNSISNAWNFLFMTLNCCGVNAVVSTTNDFDATTWCTTSGSCQATSSQIPKTCCLNVDENTYSSAPSGCHASVNSGTYNTEGCYDALKDTLLTYSSSVIGLVSATFFLQTTAVILGYVLLCKTFGEETEVGPSA